MPGPALVALAWQRHSQLDNRSVHSLLISLLRGCAALQVAAAHLRSEMFPGMRELTQPSLAYQLLAFATGFAHQAVVVFFLISGWLVGGSLLNKVRDGVPTPVRDYALDRLTRLWTVLVPALLTMLAIGAIVGDIDPARPDANPANAYSAVAFAGNLLGLQTILVDNFGGDYALWSLANETWYYVAFPLLLCVFLPGSRTRQLGAAAALIVLAGALPLSITLYFSLWLLGALFSRVRIECGQGLRWTVIAVGVCASVYFRIKGNNDDLDAASYVQDVLLSMPLLVLLSSLQMPLTLGSPAQRHLARLAHWLSEFSFTLYVIHLPLIKLLRYLGQQTLGRGRLDPTAPLDYAIYVGMLGTLLLAAYASYLLFESRTFRIRRHLKSMLDSRSQNQPVVPARVK